jgi:chromosome segregation ATPase
MPRKTDGERIDDLRKDLGELEKLVARILVHIENINKTLDDLNGGQKETGQKTNDLQREYEKELAVLKRDIEELCKRVEQSGSAEVKSEVTVLREKVARLEASRERAGNRAWSIVPNVVGAVVSGILAAIIAYYVAHK